MEEQDPSDARRNQGLVDGPRDGTIDFSRYSLAQLSELQYTLDRGTFPRNFANLLAELARRTADAPSVAAPEAASGLPPRAVTGRFTAHGGLRGWLEAKSRRLPLYGAGFIEVRPREIVLGGWQRNWLGVAHRAEIFIPLHDISDVIQGDGGNADARRESDWVRFRYEAPLRGYRFVEFQADSMQQAGALTASLPAARSIGYERWTAVREFDALLREAGGRPWLTPAIVMINVAVFAIMAVALKSVAALSAPQLMIAWGANFGPLTLHGQWWRLISALFLHGNVPHLAFNMWALWNVGRLTERLFGNWVYAFLYFACGVLSGLASIVWDPSRSTIGASGAIFGIFAAFIVFSLHPRGRVSVKVPAALWISTLIFALYNLVAGFFAPGIDNAAHVGGVISGLVLGLVMVRPLNAEARRLFPFKRVAAAAVLTALGVLAALWQASGLGDQLTGPERYLRAHLWYVNGESENLRKWQEVAVAASSGQISDIEVGERFEQEIVPFWGMASSRLKTETSSLPADEAPFAAVVADYARARYEWARAVVDATKGGNPSRRSDATRLENESNLDVARTERVALLASLDHRPRALANSRWVVAVRNWFTVGRWKCVESPAVVRKPRGPNDSKTDGPAARQAAGCRAQELFMSGEYESPDQWMRYSGASLGDLPDGGSTLDGIFSGLSNLFNEGNLDVVQSLGRAADWRRRVPHSTYPDLVQSLVFRAWAWEARGHGGANSVSPQAWAIFTLRTEMAAMGLREIAEPAKSNPIWYQLSLDVGLDQSKTADELQGVFARGSAAEAQYWPLYTRMLRILMPRWLGSQEDIHRFIKETATFPGGYATDHAKYAKLYWSYSSLEDDDVNLFAGPLASWSNMKEGFMELQRRYPQSDFILNAYAKFACMADDALSYAEVRPKLNTRPSSAAWSDKLSLQTCDLRFPAAAAAAGHTVTPPRLRLN
jgi:membrane associated rhomboid family serine protease